MGTHIFLGKHCLVILINTSLHVPTHQGKPAYQDYLCSEPQRLGGPHFIFYKWSRNTNAWWIGVKPGEDEKLMNKQINT